MNYELATQLKDAGFPKHKCKNLGEGEIICVMCEQGMNPTLSELIEACEKFEKWELFTVEHPRNGWIATMQEFDGEPLEEEVISGGYCSTPEEAVAKLWLELNKKEPRAT